jgi:hypothetical protein
MDPLRTVKPVRAAKTARPVADLNPGGPVWPGPRSRSVDELVGLPNGWIILWLL